MDAGYGARYRDLYEHHWWWRARERVVLRELDRLRPHGGWTNILDVGCGDGLLFPALARYGRHVEGVEPDEALVSKTSREAATIHIGPFDESFAPGHDFGLILFLDVLEHIEDAGAAVAHAATLLEPGGVMLVTVPAFEHLWTTHDDLNFHVTRYTKARLRRLLGSELTVERSRYYFHWVYGAKIAVRLREAVRRPSPSSPEVPPAMVNRVLYGLSVAEDLLLRWIPLPFGSSLIAVARREA